MNTDACECTSTNVLMRMCVYAYDYVYEHVHIWVRRMPVRKDSNTCEYVYVLCMRIRLNTCVLLALNERKTAQTKNDIIVVSVTQQHHHIVIKPNLALHHAPYPSFPLVGAYGGTNIPGTE